MSDTLEVTNEDVQEALDRLLAVEGVIGSLAPRRWAEVSIDHARDGLRAVMSTPNWRDLPNNEVGTIAATAAAWPITTATRASLGMWLKDNIAARAEPEFPSDQPVEWIRGGGGGGHVHAYDRMREWAENDDNDVADGVDEQMTTEPVSAYIETLCSSCRAHGDTKDFIGAVMRYKKARLARSESEHVLQPGDIVRSLAYTGERVGDQRCTVPGAEVGKQYRVTRLENVGGQDYVVAAHADAPEDEWFFYPNHVEFVQPVTPDDVVGVVVDRVTELERELERAKQAHRDDIAAIGERLIAEARSHAWCSEYDDVINDLNDEISVELPPRNRDYTVRWTETYTVNVARSITVTEPDEGSARDTAWNDYAGEMGRSDIASEIREGGANVDWNNDNREDIEFSVELD